MSSLGPVYVKCEAERKTGLKKKRIVKSMVWVTHITVSPAEVQCVSDVCLNYKYSLPL